MKLTLLWRALLICAGLLLQAHVAFACSCGPAPPVLDAYEGSGAVVIARVLSVEGVKKAKTKYMDEALAEFSSGFGPAKLLVEKVYKGNLRVNDEIAFPVDSTCGWTFHEQTVGHQFLLYLIAPRESARFWHASACGRSRSLEWATEDFLYLDNMAKLLGKTRVSGNYRGGLNSKLDDVAGKRIRVVGEKKTYETKTDANGVFEIYDLPPGTYSLQPEIPQGWQIARYAASFTGQPSARGTPKKSLLLTLEAKKHVTLDVLFEPNNTVEGRVVDPDGNPMSGVCAHLWKDDQVKVSDSFSCTNDNGQFRIEAVPPGSYVLVLNPDSKISSEEPFSRLFYPNVTQREKAALINIGNGETVKGIDLVIPKLAETITVSGVLQFSDEKPAGDELIYFKASPQDGIDGDVTELTDSQGRFTITLLKSVKGEIAGEFKASLGEYEKCPKLDALIKATGEQDAEIKTSPIKIDGGQRVDSLVLKFPFPKCKPRDQ